MTDSTTAKPTTYQQQVEAIQIPDSFCLPYSYANHSAATRVAATPVGELTRNETLTAKSAIESTHKTVVASAAAIARSADAEIAEKDREIERLTETMAALVNRINRIKYVALMMSPSDMVTVDANATRRIIEIATNIESAALSQKGAAK